MKLEEDSDKELSLISLCSNACIFEESVISLFVCLFPRGATRMQVRKYAVFKEGDLSGSHQSSIRPS